MINPNNNVRAGLKPAPTYHGENMINPNDNVRAGFKPAPTQTRRKSIRLPGYDYSQNGAYFVTICAHNRQCSFGDVIDGEMVLNEYGKIVVQCWWDLPNHYKNMELDCFIVMPNHFHGIIVIANIVRAGLKPAPTHHGENMINANNIAGAGLKPARTHHGLPEYIRALKTFSSKQINKIRNATGIPVWQRNYHEHIIRNDNDLNQIREYIQNNPLQWKTDENNPLKIKNQNPAK